MFSTAILWITHRLWNRQIARILNAAYGNRVINSRQLHILAAAFDPTQNHKVYGKYKTRGFRDNADSDARHATERLGM